MGACFAVKWDRILGATGGKKKYKWKEHNGWVFLAGSSVAVRIWLWIQFY